MHLPRPLERSAAGVGWTVALAGWSLFTLTSLQVYLARAHPEELASGSVSAWLVAGEDLAGAAQRHLESGLLILNDTSRPTADRIQGYRHELELAESLLARAVRSCPTQALALAQLAAVRWELAPPTGGVDLDRHLELIRVAASVAPNSARVKLQLGELLLQMGLTEPALTYLRGAVELAPGSSRDVVAVLEQNLFEPPEILARLPPIPPVLIAVYETFPEASSEPELLEAFESALEPKSVSDYPSLLLCYARSCLRQDRAERLRSVLDRIGPLRESRAEALRLQQRSRADLALGRIDDALEGAESARDVAPDSGPLAEYLGDLRLLRGDAAGALGEFREALRLLARGSGDPSARARLYRKTGEAEERLGAADRAYDAYQRALQLDPSEEHAAERVRALRAAAGIGP